MVLLMRTFLCLVWPAVAARLLKGCVLLTLIMVYAVKG